MLALIVVAVVAMMIVPLPTWLLDILLAANLSAAVAILLVVLYVPDTLSIAAFPTLLLITTLLRLALNVSSSRLILLQANAGEVIRSFGQFVVRGNYVVGAVIFLILTVIQFVVIAKGSERVAEVGARFVLDALPGKQMAIDAELRSGTIDGADARRRRRALVRESQFYGAMDGAMKFVKGDVIASLVITAVNILGGLAIGVGQRDMGAVDALKRYGLLTIGDGLVSQIPALVLSTAAGVLVTRTASEEPDTPLGSELARQLFSTPRALGVAALFVCALSIVPGLPTLPFLTIGVALGVVATARHRSMAREAHARLNQPVGRSVDDEDGDHFVPMVVPWSIEIAQDAPDAILAGVPAKSTPGLGARALQLRSTIFAALGVPLPRPLVGRREDLPTGHAVISMFEVPAELVDLSGVDPNDADAYANALMARVEHVLRSRAAEFLGLTETQRLLDELETFQPQAVRTVVPKPISLTLLTDILKRLVEEGLSIRDLRTILEALAAAGHADKDPLTLTELARSHMRRAITFDLTGGRKDIQVVVLDEMVEDSLRRAVQRTAHGAYLALSPHASADLTRAIGQALEAGFPGDGSAPPVILTQPDIRRFVRKLIEVERPDVRVISYAELLPETRIALTARASIANA